MHTSCSLFRSMNQSNWNEPCRGVHKKKAWTLLEVPACAGAQGSPHLNVGQETQTNVLVLRHLWICVHNCHIYHLKVTFWRRFPPFVELSGRVYADLMIFSFLLWTRHNWHVFIQRAQRANGNLISFKCMYYFPLNGRHSKGYIIFFDYHTAYTATVA